jgi:hypothetical protein
MIFLILMELHPFLNNPGFRLFTVCRETSEMKHLRSHSSAYLAYRDSIYVFQDYYIRKADYAIKIKVLQDFPSDRSHPSSTGASSASSSFFVKASESPAEVLIRSDRDRFDF